MQEEIVKISGMSCQACVRSVEKALTSLDGLARVNVSLEQGEARVVFDPARLGLADIRAAVLTAGFELG